MCQKHPKNRVSLYPLPQINEFAKTTRLDFENE